jgi:hypothetical protein
MAEHHQHHLSVDQHDPPDEWHLHTDEDKPQHAHGEVANAHLIMAVGIACFVLVVATIAITYGYYTWYTTRLLDQVQGQDPAYRQYGMEGPALSARASAQQDLRGYSWVEPAPPVVPVGTIQIPVEKATARFVKEYTSR